MAYSPVPIGWPEKVQREERAARRRELSLWRNRRLILRFCWYWLTDKETRATWRRVWKEEAKNA